ncbi:uncharacterized protein LOC144545426 [Carex rostrata]
MHLYSVCLDIVLDFYDLLACDLGITSCSFYSDSERFVCIKSTVNSIHGDTHLYQAQRSANIGIFISVKCFGVHRSLGTHISKSKHKNF